MKVFFSILALVTGLALIQAFASEDPTSSDNSRLGEVYQDNRVVEPFQNIAISGAMDVEIKIGSTTSIDIESEKGNADLIETRVDNGTLRIHPKKKAWTKRIGAIKVFVTVPDLQELKVSGASDVHLLGNSISELKMRISGASDIFSNVTFGHLMLDASGASDIKLEGKAQSAKFLISGASDIKAATFEVEDMKANVSGASDVKVIVSNNLDIMASGASSFKYDGNPSIGKRSVSGAADVEQM